MVSVWPQWWQPVGGPRDKIWDLVALVWPIRSRVITTSSALVRCWNFFGGPSVGIYRDCSLKCDELLMSLPACLVFKWLWFMSVMKQGKSEGFESCDRPIVRKRPIWVKIGDVLSRVTLKFDGWPWKTIGASLLCCFKLSATFYSHRWIQTGVTVRQRPIWVKFDDF